MKKWMIILIVTASILLVVGCSIVAIAAVNNKGTKLVTKEVKIEEEFNDFEINISTADLVFEKTDSENAYVKCEEKQKIYFAIKVEENKLKIDQIDTRKWFETMTFFDFKSEKVSIYLPTDTFNNLNIEASTGNITIEEFNFHDIHIVLSTGNTTLKKVNANDLTIDASTGNINLIGVRCEAMDLDASTGDVLLDDTIGNGLLKIKVSTGNVSLKRSDAKTMNIHTSTGNVKGDILTEKNFYAKTSTGKVDVPKTSGEIAEIETSTGDIIIRISE